ncbi:MAG: 16S rRNA (guanine(527)-N(7))-methyltransferase RsmG [Alphaproteobacteria bacterium]|jgi:16S rRNA (guanine527-N7)-methyltransferase
MKNLQINKNLINNITDIQATQIENFVSLLKKWNKAYSLIGNQALNEINEIHIPQAIILSRLLEKEGEVYDLGSGNGLPSIILAIFLPNTKIFAIEISSKKCVFLQNLKVNLGLNNFSVIEKKVEEVNLSGKTITAKAFSALYNILGLFNKKFPSQLYLLKGEKTNEEIEVASKKFTFSHELIPLKIKEREVGMVLYISKIQG